MFNDLSDYEKARLFVAALVYTTDEDAVPDVGWAVKKAEALLDELGIANPDTA